VASRNVKVLVVGNPANTNAYIAMKSAPDLKPGNFTAMLRLDHNRALSQMAAKTGKPSSDIKKLAVWGNHSPTMYADYRFATINGASVKDMINDQVWNANTCSCPPWASAARPSLKRAWPVVGRVGRQRRHRPHA
jgi:malate dehydrogenase